MVSAQCSADRAQWPALPCASSWPAAGPGRASPAPSEGVRPPLTSADAGDGGDVDHPDLAVTDLPRAGRRGDHVDDLVAVRGVAHDLDLDLGQEVDRVLRAAVGLGLPALPTAPLPLRYG